MYLIVASFIVSSVIIGFAHLMDNNRNRCKTIIEPRNDDGDVKIEVLNESNQDDVDALVKVEARAFQVDPGWAWAVGGKDNILAKIEYVKVRMLWLMFPFNHVFIATRVIDGKRTVIGGVSFNPPGHKYTQMDIVRAGILKVPFVWGFSMFFRLFSLSSAFEKIQDEKTKGKETWRISNFAVDPSEQGKGVGRKLLKLVLDHADKTKAICYLETSNPPNVAMYEHFGFAVANKHEPKDGPPMWMMIRPPHSHSSAL